MLKNKNVLVVALAMVVNAIGYGIVIPILYPYSLKFGLTDFQNGLLFASFSICQFISTPIIGRLSDKYGRKPLLIVSIAGSAVSFFMMAFAPSAIFLFIARGLDGLTAGNFPVAQAVVSDSTTDKDRAKGFGVIGAAFGFGLIFGPVISALTVKTSLSLPFLIAGLISVIATLINVFFLKETNKHIGKVSTAKLFDFAKIASSLIDKNVGPTFLITLLSSLAFSVFIYGFNPYAIKVLSMSEQQVALVFSLIGVVGVFTQVALLSRTLKFFGIRRSFYGSLALMSLLFAALYFSDSILVYTVFCMLISLPNSFVNPLISTILSRETDEKSQGSIMGLNYSYMSIGQIVGPILGGIFATISFSAPFLVSSAVILPCIYLAHRSLSPDHHKQSAF